MTEDWIEIPEGFFWMGGGPRDDENPRHRVRVRAFLLARTQVTREQFQRFLDATGRAAPPFWNAPPFAHPRMPAVGPSWEDAVAFCDWAGERLGRPVRLPTEAEWEHAAKAGRDATWPWGEDPPESLPDYPRRWQGGPEPVDAYPSLHPLGLLGLGENVHEWCRDWYDAGYYEVSPQVDPRGPERGIRRASRGGSWRHQVKVSRCAARSSIAPGLQYSDYGFRLAADLTGAGT